MHVSWPLSFSNVVLYLVVLRRYIINPRSATDSQDFASKRDLMDLSLLAFLPANIQVAEPMLLPGPIQGYLLLLPVRLASAATWARSGTDPHCAGRLYSIWRYMESPHYHNIIYAPFICFLYYTLYINIYTFKIIKCSFMSIIIGQHPHKLSHS